MGDIKKVSKKEKYKEVIFMDVGKRIAKLREAMGMNQLEFANKVHINNSVMNRIEKGIRPIRDDELLAISKCLNVSVDYLLGNSTSKEIPTSNLLPLTSKDERDIARDLENMIESLDDSAARGNTEDDEDRELLRVSLETAMKIAKRTAKKKFTPKKYMK